jgi:hypothetical protein
MELDYSRHMPVTVSQGNCGSCVLFSFATTALMYTNMFREEYKSLPPVRGDYDATIECYDRDRWQYQNEHSWAFDARIFKASGEPATADDVKAEGDLGEALIARINGAAGTELTLDHLVSVVTRGRQKEVYLRFNTEGVDDDTNFLLTEDLWRSVGLEKSQYDGKDYTITTTVGNTYTVNKISLRHERTICDGAHYDYASGWQIQQQIKHNRWVREESTDVGHVPLTLAPGVEDKIYFGAPDRTKCTDERVLAARSRTPGPDHIVSMTSAATQILDERVQDEAFTELNLGIAMPRSDGRGTPGWTSHVTNSSFNLMYALTRYGPVSLALRVCRGFSAMKSDTISADFNCPDGGGHQVVAVGFSYDPARPIQDNYFLIANSWGPHWGNNGIGRIYFGSSAIKTGVVPIYGLRVPDFPYIFSSDRFTTFDEAVVGEHAYRGSVTAAAMFEHERDIIPLPTGSSLGSNAIGFFYHDNPWMKRMGALDPPVGKGRWYQMSTSLAEPSRHRLMHRNDRLTVGRTIAAMPRFIVDTLSIVVTVADADIAVVRGSTLRLSVNVWSRFRGSNPVVERPLVYPLGVATVDGDSWQSEPCEADGNACTRWIGGATFRMLPDVALSGGFPTDMELAQMLPTDEWYSIEMFAEWTDGAAAASVPLYFYGGSVRVNRDVTQQYGVTYLVPGAEIPQSELKEFSDAAYGTVPAGWRAAGALDAGSDDDSSSPSTTTIAIIVASASCALLLCAGALCALVLLATRSRASRRPLPIANTRHGASRSSGRQSRRASSHYRA